MKSRGGTNGVDVRIIFKWILNRIGGREIDWFFSWVRILTGCFECDNEFRVPWKYEDFSTR